MRRLVALLVGAAAVAACGGKGATNGPVTAPSLPPAGAFKDGLIYAAVKARLAGADIDNATRISVAVHSGVVTLRGAVPDPSTRDRDVKLVRSMRGVTSVTDELRIGHSGPSVAQTVRNVELIAAVTSALTAQAGINVGTVGVRASAGVVTLSGHAPTAAIKATLLSTARATPGVRNVIDRITVQK